MDELVGHLRETFMAALPSGVDAAISAVAMEASRARNRPGTRCARFIRRVALYHGVSVGHLLHGGRCPALVRPRQMLMWVLRQDGASYPVIGRAMGLDHTTVMSGVRKVEMMPGMLAEAQGLLAYVEKLEGVRPT